MIVRTIIVDDEPPARSRVRNLLSSFQTVDVIKECADGLSALRSIEALKPDLVFLDIQMPGLNGFEVLNQLNPKIRPHIIFTTAFDQYALKAFEHHAMDYLLKPLDKARFEIAVDKVLTQIKGQSADGFSDKLRALLSEYEQQVNPEIKSFVIKDKGLNKAIRADEVFWIESEGNYAKLHSHQGEFLYRSSLSSLESELLSFQFLRIHRSILVNALHIEKTQYLNNDTFKFFMNGDSVIISGRSYKSAIQAFLASANYIQQF